MSQSNLMKEVMFCRDKHDENILIQLFPYDYSESDLLIFVTKLMKVTNQGFLVQDRKHQNKTHKQCLIGSEYIDWLMKNTSIASEEENIRRRLTLKFFCQTLLEIGVIKHVTERKNEFKDDLYFFQLVNLTSNQILKNYEDLKSIVLLLNSNEKLKELIFIFISNLDLKDKNIHFKKHKFTFIGSEVVNFLSKYFDISRCLSMKICDFIRQLGIFKHITDEQNFFADEFVYYSLSEDCFDFFEKEIDTYKLSNEEELKNWIKKLEKNFESTQEFTTIPNLYRNLKKKDLHDMPPLLKANLQYLLLKKQSKYLYEHDLNIFIGNWCLSNSSILEEESLNNFLQKHEFDADIYAIGIQEIDSNAKSFVKESKSNITSRIDEMFDLNDYKKIETYQIHGIYNMIYIKNELMNHFKDSMIIFSGIGKLGSRSKGALGVRFSIDRNSFCFVSGYVSSHTKLLQIKNQNLTELMSKIVFDNAVEKLQMNDHDFVFFYGNFNYGISLKNEDIMNLIEKKDFKTIAEKDDLYIEKKNSKILTTFEEANLNFCPNFIDKKQTSYSDRIFWLKNKDLELNQLEYKSLENFKSSNYQPIISTFKTKILLKNYEKYDNLRNELIHEILSSKRDKKILYEVISKFPSIYINLDEEDKESQEIRKFLKYDVIEYKNSTDDVWTTADCYLFSDILLIKDTISSDEIEQDEISSVYCHLIFADLLQYDQEEKCFALKFLDEKYSFKNISKEWIYSINNNIESERKKLIKKDENLNDLLTKKKNINKKRNTEVDELNQIIGEYEEIFKNLLQKDDDLDELFLFYLREDSAFLPYYQQQIDQERDSDYDSDDESDDDNFKFLDEYLNDLKLIKDTSLTIEKKKSMKDELRLILDYKIDKKNSLSSSFELNSKDFSPRSARSPRLNLNPNSWSPRSKSKVSPAPLSPKVIRTPTTPRSNPNSNTSTPKSPRLNRRLSVRDKIQNIEKMVSSKSKSVIQKYF
eukprot:gene3029-5039_t